MKIIPKKLIVIGDSSVYGWGDTEGGGWCERLKMDWISKTNKPIIYNLGIRGDGLERVAKRCISEWEVRGELRRQTPDGILLSIGLNDTARIGSIEGRPQLSLDAFQYGLNQLLSKISSLTNIFVMGLTPVDELKMPFAECLWYSNKACKEYEKIIEEACLTSNVNFLATFKEMSGDPRYKNWISNDGLHLNSSGHKWIYQRLKSWDNLINWSKQ
tara:strand:+ start:2599 stop:3243 length:645 start_codon:yes stop_codon:yes gene_type:complete